MKDIELELAKERQRKPTHPMYLAQKFNDWTQKTGILSGGGLTWMARIPAQLIMILISLIYWLLTGKGSKV